MMGAPAVLHHIPSPEVKEEEEEDQQMHPPSSQSWEIPELPADSSFVNGVASRDVFFSTVSSSVWLRMFLPEAAAAAAGATTRLPILVHVHGGGFVRFSAATASYHEFCKKVATDAGVLVLSLNHRLAPEHRLPAAYEDLVESLKWLQAQAECTTDPWLNSHADFSSVILMGGSSGGNIVHHTLLGLNPGDFLPLKFTGQVLLQPFFGGGERTKSELRLCDGPILTLSMSDQLWKMALPVDAGREHPYCSPVVVGGFSLPKSLVVVGGRDLLHDRQVEYASGGFVTSEGTVSYVFMDEVLDFIRSCT